MLHRSSLVIAVIAGIPVTVTQAAVNLGPGAKAVSYSLVNQVGDDVTQVQLLLLDFNLKGQLQSEWKAMLVTSGSDDFGGV